ncbi:hypothetical protein BDV35DRAFT_342435 [Aspergillus flavus]|uniref:Uncharacterized protein n=1 Tax=Aspergillus flavus TaxID=5059 RepID=A0A5N6H6P9_ASPFL|nr:hypothetical protein BDV35DRAFT_342435 [Aspergillus flavus]
MTGLIGIPDTPWKGCSSRFDSFGNFLPVGYCSLFYFISCIFLVSFHFPKKKTG